MINGKFSTEKTNTECGHLFIEGKNFCDENHVYGEESQTIALCHI